jgi:cell division septum initiation protein DivIVA
MNENEQLKDRIADLETAVVFLRKALDDTLDALSSAVQFAKAIEERSRSEN